MHLYDCRRSEGLSTATVPTAARVPAVHPDLVILSSSDDTLVGL